MTTAQRNRLYTLLTQKTPRPWLAVVGGALVGGLVLASVLIAYDQVLYTQPLFLISLSVVMITMSILGAAITRREIKSEQYQILRLAPLPPREIMQGFIFTVLFRTRLLVAAVVVASTALVIFPYLSYHQSASQDCYKFVPPDVFRSLSYPFETQRDFACAKPFDSRLLLSALPLISLPVLVWGSVLLNTALGVATSLSQVTRPLSNLLLAVIILSLIGPLLYIVALTVLGPQSAGIFYCLTSYPLRCTYFLPWPSSVPVIGLGVTLLPYLITWLLIRFAR